MCCLPCSGNGVGRRSTLDNTTPLYAIPFEMVALKSKFETLRYGVESLGLGTIDIRMAHYNTDARADEDNMADWMLIVCSDARGEEIAVMYFLTQLYPDEDRNETYASVDAHQLRFEKLFAKPHQLSWDEAYKRIKRAYGWLAKDKDPRFANFPEPQYMVVTHLSFGFGEKMLSNCEGPYQKELADIRLKDLQSEYKRFADLTASAEGKDTPMMNFVAEVIPISLPQKLALLAVEKST
ncbi:MAG: hypothetical protein JWN37_793 [Candidatus Nomurabacteria bacterium]|nr:hypothetical protein [Candidatus Nomurabacteria bacterium]